MPGQFINTGTNPGGKLSLTNVSNQGNLTFVGPPPPPTYTIGESALGGLIAYINGGGSSGTSGFVVTAADLVVFGSTLTRSWSTTNAFTGATGTAIGTGASNTAAIVAYYGAGLGYAAGVADAATDGGYTDWYLPSKDEWYAMYLNNGTLGIGTNIYWTSSETILFDDTAWSQYVSNGSQLERSKNDSLRVRAIRSF
jgi:hypothetical protein